MPFCVVFIRHNQSVQVSQRAPFLRMRGTDRSATAWLPDARRRSGRWGGSGNRTTGSALLSCTLRRTRTGGSDDVTSPKKTNNTHTHARTDARALTPSRCRFYYRALALPPSFSFFCSSFFSILGSGARNNPVYFPLRPRTISRLALNRKHKKKQQQPPRPELDCLLSTHVNVPGTTARVSSLCVCASSPARLSVRLFLTVRRCNSSHPVRLG